MPRSLLLSMTVAFFGLAGCAAIPDQGAWGPAAWGATIPFSYR